MPVTKFVPISTLRPGDTVIHEGFERTVGPSNLRHGGFFGTTLFGDSYKAGYAPVELVVFPRFYRGVLVPESSK